MDTFIQHQAFIEPIAEVMVRSLLATTILLVVMWGVLAF